MAFIISTFAFRPGASRVINDVGITFSMSIGRQSFPPPQTMQYAENYERLYSVILKP